MKPKTIAMIIAAVIIVAPWLLIWGQFKTADGIHLDSKTFRSVFGINETHTSRNRRVSFESEYDFFFSTGSNKYIAISSNKTSTLKNALFQNSEWSLPNGFEIIDSQVDIVPKWITWTESSILGESISYSADGFALKIKVTMMVKPNAELGNNNIAISLPNMRSVEQEVNASIVFPNDNIKSNNQIIAQWVTVHKTGVESFLAGAGKLLVSFFGVGLYLVSMFFMASESGDKKP